MASYKVKILPRPRDRVYIKFPNNQEYQIEDATTIELSEEPKEITIRRERTWRRIFTSWRCMYVTITSLDSETELYFPVFKDIGSAGLAIKENSAYVSQNWKNDVFFGNLYLNGCNPIMIKRYTEDQQKIPMETLEKVYLDIKENIQILCATGRYTLPINITARTTLINEGGFFMYSVPLGEYPEEVAYESHMRDPLMEFKSTLKGIGEKIRRRSACQEFPYEYLHPEGMENSVTI